LRSTDPFSLQRGHEIEHEIDFEIMHEIDFEGGDLRREGTTSAG